jgi:hypothetical protein
MPRDAEAHRRNRGPPPLERSPGTMNGNLSRPVPASLRWRRLFPVCLTLLLSCSVALTSAPFIDKLRPPDGNLFWPPAERPLRFSAPEDRVLRFQSAKKISRLIPPAKPLLFLHCGMHLHPAVCCRRQRPTPETAQHTCRPWRPWLSAAACSRDLRVSASCACSDERGACMRACSDPLAMLPSPAALPCPALPCPAPKAPQVFGAGGPEDCDFRAPRTCCPALWHALASSCVLPPPEVNARDSAAHVQALAPMAIGGSMQPGSARLRQLRLQRRACSDPPAVLPSPAALPCPALPCPEGPSGFRRRRTGGLRFQSAKIL